MLFPSLQHEDVAKEEIEPKSLALPSVILSVPLTVSASVAAIVSCKILTEVKLVSTINTESILIKVDPYTTEEKDIDLSELKYPQHHP